MSDKRRVLTRTAEIIRQRGWGEGHLAFYGDGINGAVCVMGALHEAITGELPVRVIAVSDIDAYTAVADHPAAVALAACLNTKPMTLWRWNDQRARAAARQAVMDPQDYVIQQIRDCADRQV